MQLVEMLRQGVHCLLDNAQEQAAQWMMGKLLTEFPNDAQLHHEAAILYHKQGDMTPACQHFKRAADLAPSDAIIQKSLADFYHAVQGRTEKAIVQYLKVLSLNPRELDTLLTVAHLYVSLHHFDNARDYYERVLAIDPTHAEARQILNKLVSRQPVQPAVKSPDELYKESCDHVQAGRQQDAIRTLESLIASQPDHALAHNDLGVLYYESDNMPKAQHHYERATALSPDNITFLKNLAEYYYLEKADAEKALQKYVQALNLDSQDVECLMGTGHICMALGKNEDARVFFARVLEIEPWNFDADQLLRQVENPSASPPTSPPAPIAQTSPEDLYRQAQEKAAQGDLQAAVRALNELLALEPDHSMAINDLGVLQYEMGNPQSALSYYERAATLAPNNHTIQKNLADFYFVEQGRTEDALKIYVKILEADPQDTDCLMAAGSICSALGRDGDARTFYERVLEIDPWHDQARQEMDRINNAPEWNFGRNIAAFGQKIAL